LVQLIQKTALCCYQEGPHRSILLQTQREASHGGDLIGTFAEFGKILTIRFVMPVRPSAWEINSAPTERIFIKFGIHLFFETLSRKFTLP